MYGTMCRNSSKDKWRFKRLVDSDVLKFLCSHVQWNVSCTASFARLYKPRESFIIATADLFKANNYQRSGTAYMIRNDFV